MKNNIYLTSDTHWGHTKIIEYSNRPFTSTEEMNEALITNWNAIVGPKDTVYHLGDFAWGPYSSITQILRRLNGDKHLILGNHDQTIIKHRNDLTSPALFGSIQNYKELKYDGHLLILFHYGQRVWNKSHHGSIMLYGHSHGSLPPYGRSVDVGVDSKYITPEYRPVSIQEILKFMEDRPVERPDHHGSRPFETNGEE